MTSNEKPNMRKCEGGNLRKQVCDLLVDNPSFTAKNICKELGLSYKRYKAQVWNACSHYRESVRKHKVSNLSTLRPVSAHFGWFWVVLPRGSRRSLESKACSNGWRVTRARNRFLQWVDPQKIFGSCKWYLTDRVSLRVRVPVNYGRAKTLFTLAFGRVLDVESLLVCQDCIRFKGADHVFDVGTRLKPFRIKFFQKSNGVEIFSDRSHPGKLEVRAFYPDYAERAEGTLLQFIDLFKEVMNNGGKNGSQGKERGQFEFYG